MLTKIRESVAWKRVKIALYVLALVAVVLGIQIFITDSFRDESKLIRSFNKTLVTPVRGKLQVVGNFGDKYMTTEDKKGLIDYVSSQLGIANPLDKKVKKGDTTISITAQAEGKTSQTDIEAISITSDSSEPIKKTIQYLYVTIDLYHNMDSLIEYKKIIEDTFNNVGLDNIDSSIVLSGTYDGKLNLLEKNRVTEEILDSMQADVVSENRSENLYTVYAYTENIGDYLELQGSKVNLNIGFSYNESKDETTLYIGTPIINEDY